MTHPLEQLAPYVDGSLPPSERGAVDEHLRACSRCREQVRAAGLARAALRSLESPPGPDIAAGFGPERVAEVTSPRAPTSPRWTKVAAGLAAAAVVAAVALVVPRLGTSSDDAGTAALGAADAETDATEGPAAARARRHRVRRRIDRAGGGRGRGRCGPRRDRGRGRRRRGPRRGAPPPPLPIKPRSRALGEPTRPSHVSSGRSPGSRASSCGSSAPRSRARPPTSGSCSKAPAPARPRTPSRSGSPRSRTARSSRSRPRVSERPPLAPGHGSGMPERSSLWEDSLT